MGKFSTIIIAVCLIVFAAFSWAWGSSPLTLTYAGGQGSGGSESRFSDNRWTYTYQYHVLVLTGDVPQGRLFSQLQLGEIDGKMGLTSAKMDLSGKTYAIDLGDNVVNFSDLTLNSMAYQGASVTLKPSDNFNIQVLGGARGSGIWGADVLRDTRPRENFSGVRTQVSPINGLGLTTTYLTTPGGQDVFAYGSDYTLDDLKLDAEYGSATLGKAFRQGVRYQNNWLTLGTIYRDIDPTYNVPFDYVSYQGMKGTYTTVGLRPMNNLAINMQSNSYTDRLNGTGEAMNLDTSGDISYNMSTGTNIGFSGWSNDRSEYERGNITQGEIMYITQQFWLFTKNAVYYRQQPTWFESLNSSEESYTEKKDVTGITISLFDAMHLNYEVENATKIFTNLDTKVNPSAITARADLFESQILDSPFYISSSVYYRKDIPDTHASEEATTTTTYSDVTLKYTPNQDFSCFVTTKVFDLSSPDALKTARQQTDLSYGLNYTFNTNFYLF